MVPLNMTYLRCLQHSLFEHLFNLYWSIFAICITLWLSFFEHINKKPKQNVKHARNSMSRDGKRQQTSKADFGRKKIQSFVFSAISNPECQRFKMPRLFHILDG